MSEDKKQLWSHQPPAIEFMCAETASLLDAWMGTGKTFMTIQVIRRFGTIGRRATLIMCPEKVMGVWRGEFEKHAPNEFSVVILDGKKNAAEKAKRVEQALAIKNVSKPLVVVVNYETMIRDPVFSVLSVTLWSIVVADEIHKLKGHGTQTSIKAWKIGWKAQKRIGLTGTPMPHSPADFFGQFRFLDDRIFGKYWTKYKKEFSIPHPEIKHAVLEWIKVDEIRRRGNRIRYHIPKDVLVLPEKQFIEVGVRMSPAGYRKYVEMRNEAVVEIRRLFYEETGRQLEAAVAEDEEQAVSVISACNGGVQFLRLLQMAQGFITDTETGQVHEIDSEKKKVLLEYLEQSQGEPVCVYGWFHHDMDAVRQCCELLGLRYGEVSGRRKDLTPEAKFPPDIDVLGVQAKSGSAGIDLTRARIGIILNTGTLSPGDYDQMIARQHRPGQKNSVIYYTLVAEKTVEVRILQGRLKRRSVISCILDDFVGTTDVREEVEE